MKCFFLLMLTSLTTLAAALEMTNIIPSVTIQGNTYSNVVLRDFTSSSVMFSHTRGMASFNPDRLTLPELQQLTGGPPAKASSEVQSAQNQAGAEEAAGTNTLERLKSHLPTKMEMPTHEQIEKLWEDTAQFRTPAIVGFAVAYLFVGICFALICSKAGKPSALLVWIPILNMYPLFKAAAMSPAWFRLMLISIGFEGAVYYLAAGGLLSESMVPMFTMLAAGLFLIPSLGWLIWAFKICKARGKSPALGIFLLLPCTNIFALAYLAFSK